MDFTFGICATSANKEIHDDVLESIIDLKIPNYEILMIGGDIYNSKAECIDFDEFTKPGWITKKKNILCQEAKYENIVLMHDYLFFHPGWYHGFKRFGGNFDVAMNIILNSDGSRFRDWCLSPYDVIPPLGPIINREFFLPYTHSTLTNKMYISGTYWVAKKKFMLENPLDEELSWGQSEDLRWSELVRHKTVFKMNPYSAVMCIKHKFCDFQPITHVNLEKLTNLYK
jgi:hypothetical protein